MTEAALLHCPIRGSLRVRQKAADDLTFTEEKHRIDAIKYLIRRKYPKEYFGVETTLFRLGHEGRNSFRTDFAVYDEPFDNLRGLPLEQRLERVRLLAEIKRDNSSAKKAKATQVRSALQLVPDFDSLGVYWDDVEQRFFYRRLEGKRTIIHDAPINKIPDWGASLGSTYLFYDDLDPAKDLVRIFDEIEDAFHAYVVDQVQRYTIIQQMLLTKIHDENTHRSGTRKDVPLEFQDFTVEPISDEEVMKRLNVSLGKAAAHYNVYLPEDKQIDEAFRCPAEALRNATKILAPVNILKSRTQVIQAFYMKFAKSLYKWDLAQYFTPHEVIDFIVDIVNPRADEHVHDPACGSADFLISAFRRAGPTARNCVWGADNSAQAVQISILNMVLNGDGKTSIKNQDSLKEYSPKSRTYSVVLCNPPFGTKIVDRRHEVLRKFDVGRRWVGTGPDLSMTEEVRDSQQTGILFAELCVRLAVPGGRVGIILPNGYLGNSGTEYVALRHWLLRHARIAAIVAFPRFTFKKSGADVSASVLVLEKRREPLRKLSDDQDYCFFVGNIESVGWRAGDKLAVPLYLRDQMSGALVLDPDNEPILDADFNEVTAELLRSPAVPLFPWLAEDRELPAGAQSWSVDVQRVISAADLNLDPKRHSFKFSHIRAQIAGGDHFVIGDVLEAVKSPRFKVDPAKLYRYVEIERIGSGEYDYAEMRGWQLPDRARLRVNRGDIFIASLWGCAGKWFMTGGDCTDMIVTNGCSRFRIKDNARGLLPDLLIGLSSEAFSIQLRGLTTGSDGLAEVSSGDLLRIVLPRVAGADLRGEVESRAAAVLSGDARFPQFLRAAARAAPGYVLPPPRKSHVALV